MRCKELKGTKAVITKIRVRAAHMLAHKGTTGHYRDLISSMSSTTRAFEISTSALLYQELAGSQDSPLVESVVLCATRYRRTDRDENASHPVPFATV